MLESKTQIKAESIGVLHVDDDRSFLEISKLILLDLNGNFEIDFALSVDEALQKIGSTNYDAIVSDYEMPQKNGLQFLTELRKRNNKTPFILFTGKGREEVAIKALNLGADGYFNKQGTPKTVYGELSHGILQSVEYKRAEEGLRISEANFRAYLESSPVSVFVANQEGKYEYLNTASCKLLGYSSEELLKMTVQQVVPQEDIHKQRFSQLMEKGHVAEEMRLRRKNGTIVDVFLSASKLPDGKLVAFCEDITERKKVEASLVESEQQFRQAFAIGHDAFLISKLKESTLIDVNQRFLEVFGYSRQEVIGKSALDLGLWANPSEREKIANQLTIEGKIRNRETLCQRKNGETFPILLSVTILKAHGQNLVLSTVRDISSYKQTEAALRESEANYRSLIEGMDESIWVINFDGGFVDVNNAAVKALGYSREELLTLGIKGIDKYLNSEQLKNLFYKLDIEGHQVFETVHTAKDGRQIPVEISSSIVTYRGKQAILSIARNITNRKKTEDSLRKSEERFRCLAESLPEIVFETDPFGKLVYVNPITFEMSGYSKDDFKKGVYNLDFFAPEDVDRAKRNFTNAMITSTSTKNEYLLVKKDGTKFPAIIEGSPIKFEGKTVGMRGIIIDLTERKKAEDKQKQSNKNIETVNEKLRVVGSLTRHDLGNKLMIIKANIYLLKKQLSDKHELTQYFEKIDAAFSSSDKLLEFGSLYERIGAEKPTVIDVYDCFNQAVNLLPPLGAIKITNECQGLEVVADSLLNQLFYNFIDNSLKHGVKVTQIRLYKHANNDRVKLFYEDDGIGISEVNKSKLFEAGFTTGKGTGLGLYLVKKMMDVYGWTIQEIGKPNEGVKFEITIPNS
jgi:PAS domain S-box-containing protein